MQAGQVRPETVAGARPAARGRRMECENEEETSLAASRARRTCSSLRPSPCTPPPPCQRRPRPARRRPRRRPRRAPAMARRASPPSASTSTVTTPSCATANRHAPVRRRSQGQTAPDRASSATWPATSDTVLHRAALRELAGLHASDHAAASARDAVATSTPSPRPWPRQPPPSSTAAGCLLPEPAARPRCRVPHGAPSPRSSLVGR